MHDNTLIQDLGTLLLAAGVAGIICKRLGLSVIVGYLIAGIVIGPHMPLFSIIQSEGRIQELSDIGLVFVMFAIGLELSLSRLGRMGFTTLAATALGALFMLQFTLLLGFFLRWTTMMSLFVAAMLMVSSSAVIAKIMDELKLNHDRAAQMALAMTIVEDVVAVIMLTVLGAHGKTTSNGGSVGVVLAVLGAFVVLLIMAGLLLMPRVLRKLEKKNDPEIQTIIVVGLLLVCAYLTIKAGYSMALGAFLFGAVVAEIKQKIAIAQAFEGLRFVFSSVFFVSIGMMIDLSMLKEVWVSVLALGAFSLLVRPIACGFALILVGIPPRDARRGGLLLTPLGEFTFIIAQAGITAAILPASFYPLAVGLSILTVMVTPLLNRYSGPILRVMDWAEPKWVARAIAAYHRWLIEIQARPSPTLAWGLLRGRLLGLLVEALFVSGVLIFSGRLLLELEQSAWAQSINRETLGYVFWGLMSVVVLIPLVAIWRNISAMAMITGEWLGGATRLPAQFIASVIKAASAVGLAYWLYVVLPFDTLPSWGWAIIALAAVIVMVVFSSKLIYWHSEWENSVQEVLAEDSRAPEEVRADARVALDHSLEAWDVQLEDYVVPAGAALGGRSLAELAIPTRFGCSILEVERNGHVITATDAKLRLYPGDKILLLGEPEQITQAREFLGQRSGAPEVSSSGEVFSGSVLETFLMPECPRAGRTLAELRVARATGVRIAGIRRGDTKVINPRGADIISAGDSLLVVGTIEELRAFKQWIIAEDTVPVGA